jgi:hypothetical protein
VRPPSTFAAGTRRMADGESRHRPSSPQGTVAVPIAPSRDHRLLGGSPVKARRPGVRTGCSGTPVPQRFLFGAMANAALHLDWAGRGLAGPMVCDANDLAQAAAGAWIHGGTPVGEDPFGACTAALAEDVGHCGHQQAAPHWMCSPFDRGPRAASATWRTKAARSRGKRAQTLCKVRSRPRRATSGAALARPHSGQ